MAQLQAIFEIAAGADVDAVLSTPNLAYVVELLCRSGETLSVDDLEQIYADESWLTDRSFTWLEMQALRGRIQPAGLPAALEATADHKPDNAPQQLNAVSPEDLDCADAIEAAAMPEVLAAGKKQSLREVPPAFPVDVGGVDAEEQASR